MSSSEILDIVDEQGNVIGQDTRENIHKTGALHKEVFAWFYTSDGKIILQRRGRHLFNGAGMLDATIGGHVEAGSDYIDTLIRETKEEAGWSVTSSELIHLCTIPQKSFDASRNYTNNALKGYYAYLFKGDIKDLISQEDEVEEFKIYDIDDFPITDEDKLKEFTNSSSIEDFLPIRKIKDLL